MPGSGAPDAQRHLHSAVGVPGRARECRRRAALRWRCRRGLTPLGGPRRRTRAAAATLGAGQSRRRPSGAAQRRAGHRQIPPGAGTQRAGQRMKGRPGSSFAVRRITRTVPCIRSSSICSALLQFAARGYARRPSSSKLAADAEPLSLPPGRYAATVGGPVVAAASRRRSAADPQPAEAEREDAGSVGGVAGARRQSEQAVYCAWEDLHWADPSTLEAAHALSRPSPDDADAGAADLSPRVYAALGNSFVPQPAHPEPVRTRSRSRRWSRR